LIIFAPFKLYNKQRNGKNRKVGFGGAAVVPVGAGTDGAQGE
jgi:hypothetical protein